MAVFVLLTAFLPSRLFAGVEEHTLKNGLKVLMEEDHKSPLVVFQIWYRVGSRDEMAGRSGASHLLEHMMFKGTPRHGSKELSRTVQRHGGTDNAFTSKDYTTYFQILPSDKVGLSVDFESDRMGSLSLDEEETVSERSVVMEERRMRSEDDPQTALYELTVAAAFKVHPYRRPVIGWMEDLSSIGRDDLLAHYRSFYCPGNAFIVIVGDIEPAKLLREIETAFSGKRPCRKRMNLVSPEPPQQGMRRVYLRKEAELPFVLAAHHAPSIPDEDGYALDVLSVVLSGGKSGRLFRSLVYEKKLALNAAVDYGGTYRDPYLFILEATATPGTDVSALEVALIEEVETITASPPSDFELEKAKNQIEADFVMGQDSIFAQAMLIGRFEMLGDWRLKDRYLEQIRRVSAADVSRVAKKYLTEDNRTVGVLIPEQEKPPAGP